MILRYLVFAVLFATSLAVSQVPPAEDDWEVVACGVTGCMWEQLHPPNPQFCYIDPEVFADIESGDLDIEDCFG